MTCECGKPAKARGMCNAHYIKWQRSQPPRAKQTPFTDQVHDFLLLDGGWLTPEGIQLHFPEKTVNQVRNALTRLVDRSAVQWRAVELALHGRGGAIDKRYEWRAL